MEITLFIIFIVILLIVIVKTLIADSRLSDITYDDITNDSKALNNFEEIYNKLCSEESKNLKDLINKIKGDKKSNYLEIIIVLIFIIVMAFVILFFNTHKINSMLTEILVACCFFFFAIAIFILAIIVNVNNTLKEEENKVKYIDKYKNTVIKKFIKLFNDNLEYMPYVENPEKIIKFYEESELPVMYFQPDDLEDYIFGKIDDFNIDFVEIKNLNEESALVPLEVQLQKTFCTITLPNNNIDNNIAIVNDKKDKVLEMDNDYYKSRGYQYVQMDNQIFEDIFDVYAKDNISAMMFLTHDIMEILLDFCKEGSFRFEINIKDNHIYIIFYTGDLFEPTDFKGTIDKDNLLNQYYILDLIIKFSKQLIKILNEKNK